MHKLHTRFKDRSDQIGINMVDLMMWLVIAALLLAAAIQGIGYYQQTSYVYQIKTEADVAGSKATAKSVIENNGVMNDALIQAVVDEENAANVDKGITLTWGTISASAAAESGTKSGFSLASSVSSSVPMTGEGGKRYFLKVKHANVTDREVAYLFDGTATYPSGVNVIKSGQFDTIVTPESSGSPSGTPTTPPATTPPTTAAPTPTETATPTPTPTPTTVSYLVNDGSATMNSVWDTTIAGCTTVTLPVNGTVNVTVEWGDGSAPQTVTAAFPTHTYAAANKTQRVKVNGTFTTIGGFSGWTPKCLTEISGWGNTGTTSMANAFYLATNLVSVPQIPSTVTSLKGTFQSALNFNGDVSKWDTSNVTDMSTLFSGANSFNQPLNWNTSKVTDMSQMFNGASAFNQPITFNTTNVTKMTEMFRYANAFNSDISTIDTSNVYIMNGMFSGANNFNQPVGSWNMKNMTSAYQMFNGASKFNQSLNNWDTSKLWDTRQMFTNAVAFNQPLDKWNTISLTNTDYMFAAASSFNQPLSTWNTANVKTMEAMFLGSPMAFNQNISGWNVAKVTTHANFVGTTNTTFLPANMPKFLS